ncbi:acetyltransferase [Variovorax sp. HW608]|uniref:acetyltransferase n=1 Tax=Variovorax sp. HW608 TaxID=1034889 RepID=UPI0026D1C06D
MPAHPHLQLIIDTAAGICTSLLVDRHLAGAYRAWAVVGAFGDDLPTRASALARSLGLDDASVRSLRELGEGINYNAYGGSEEDLLLPPARLYERVRPYRDPLDFIKDEPLAKDLALRRQADLVCAEAEAERLVLPGGEVHRLPDAPWARRVLGTYANTLSQREPTRAHAVLRPDSAGAAVVSVRSPRTAPAGADVLCRGFGGSGRASAAGIDRLPCARYEAFIEAFARAFPGEPG